MAVLAWIILTPEQAVEAVALNTEAAAVSPRRIDRPLADGLDDGDLVGRLVLPARLLTDPDYASWAPLLGGCPIRTLDSDVLFQPPAAEDQAA